MTQSDRDFYAILGVSKDADDEALKKAYKKAAVKHHPDKHASKSEAEKKHAEEKFKEIAEIYEVLSDKEKRAVYDRFGEAGLRAGPAPGGGAGGGGMPAGFGGGFPGGGDFHFSSSGGGMDAARAEALFASLFGAGGLGGGGVRVMRGGKMGGMPMGGGMGGLFGGDAMDEDPFAGLMGGGMSGGLSGMGGRGGMGGRRAASGGCGSAARADTLAPGTIVRLTGLNAAGHNGAVGAVASHDAAKNRYNVRLQADGSTLSVKQENLVQVVTDARVCGTSVEALNGKTVSHATYDRASKRYRCEGLKQDGTVVALKPENVMLPAGARVTIDGVTSRPALNGCVGAVQAVDERAGRYDVQLGGGEAVRLRFGAVAAC